MVKAAGIWIKIIANKVTCFTFLCFCVFQNLHAAEVIHSSVSPEFKNGLHTKYLQYIAFKMGLGLELVPMPFARRLVALEQGEIDLMVGIKNTYPEKGFEYLDPGYERLSNIYYVRAEDASKLADSSQLKKLTIGVTIDQRGALKKAKQIFANVVTVSTLEQKIRMLHLKRIDCFVHFESSANQKIAQLGLEKEIVSAAYQPGVVREYYFAISRKSALYPLKSEFEHVIKQGVESGEFARIRLAHEELLAEKAELGIH